MDKIIQAAELLTGKKVRRMGVGRGQHEINISLHQISRRNFEVIHNFDYLATSISTDMIIGDLT